MITLESSELLTEITQLPSLAQLQRRQVLGALHSSQRWDEGRRSRPAREFRSRI